MNALFKIMTIYVCVVLNILWYLVSIAYQKKTNEATFVAHAHL